MKETADQDAITNKIEADLRTTASSGSHRKVFILNVIAGLAVVPVFFLSPMALLLADGSVLHSQVVRLSVFIAFYSYIPIYFVSSVISNFFSKEASTGGAAFKIACIPVIYLTVASCFVAVFLR